jgi:DNA helicase II / ATP-dependent DNA helicase PcrA
MDQNTSFNRAEKILEGLNDRQVKAVLAPIGPALVLAGAGSGKTKVLTQRIAYLISENLFPAENILALTFTNKAAREIQERVRKAVQFRGVPMMGTFHSVCAKILRNEVHALGYTRSFVIFDDDDQTKILREILKNKNLGTKFPPSLFRNYISTAKNGLQTPGELNLPIDAFVHNLVRDVYAEYQNELFRHNALDFDDLLMLTVKIFQNFPDVLVRYQQQFRYILVDEYQDTNHAQYVLLYLLAVGTAENAGSRNLFVVGDDAQSIYGFRGSNISNILNFEEHFPDALVIKLEQNYRSTKNILAIAHEVIRLNPEQKPKELWTENDIGDKIKVIEVGDEYEEAKFVAKTIIKSAVKEVGGKIDEVSYESENHDYYGDGDIQETKSYSILDKFLKVQSKKSGPAPIYGLPQLPEEHGTLNKYAVLYRTHAQSRAIEEVFLQSRIPYQIVGGVKFYQRKEIKDVIAYLRLVLNFKDTVALSRVINEPARGIGEKSYDVIREFISKQTGDLETFRRALTEIQLPGKQFAAVQNFFAMIEGFSMLEAQENILSLMRLITKKSGYEAWLRDGSEEGETRWENIEELFNVASRFQHLPWIEGLESLLEEIALMTDSDNTKDSESLVTMMSLHQAKGLEYDTVFLVGLEEGILPHSRALLNPVELSEEVRLAYVGVTRARNRLYMIYAQSRRMFGSLQSFPPSRILRSLPEDKISFKIINRF